MTLELSSIILKHAALKCCLIRWRRYTYDGKYWLFIFFFISWVKTTYVATMARFMLATIPVLLELHCTPCKGAELNSKRDTSPKRGKHWVLVSFLAYNPHFVLRNTWSRMCIVQFVRKYVNYILKSWHIPSLSHLLRRLSACYST